MPRPRSESFYLNLAPNVSAALSIQTKASLSSIRSPPTPPTPTTPPPTLPPVPTSPTRPFRLPNTPLIRTLVLAEDADDERDGPINPAPVLPRRRSNPDLKLASAHPTHPTRHPWSPIVPSPLRRDTSRPFCPSSLFTTHATVLPVYQIPSTTPRPVHSLSSATSTDACTLRGDAPGLKPLPRRRTPLYISTLKKAFFAGPDGSSARRFGVRTAWNIDEDVRRSLADHHLHSIFEFSSSEDEDEEDDFASPCRSSSVDHAVKEPICPVQVYPEVRPASHHKRSASEHSDEDSSSEDSSSGSDGGEEYSPTHFDESSSDEEGGSLLESEETWEMIPI